MRIDVLKRSLFQKNDHAAECNRALLDEHAIVAVNIMGGAGCGKTALLESIIPQLGAHVCVGVLEGDLATTKDADRIAALNVPVVQLLTEGGCHLTATLVEQGLKRLPLTDLDLVLIENVGNPVCPANFDLGEHFRMAVLSVTEGDDKPAKYPYLFKVANCVVITKMDLLDATDFDLEGAAATIQTLVPDAPIYTTSIKDRASGRTIVDWLLSRLKGSLSLASASSR